MKPCQISINTKELLSRHSQNRNCPVAVMKIDIPIPILVLSLVAINFVSAGDHGNLGYDYAEALREFQLKLKYCIKNSLITDTGGMLNSIG